MISGWIWQTNFAPFVEMLAFIAGYDLAPEELDALERQLPHTDGEQNAWLEYHFSDPDPIQVRFAVDPGTAVLLFEATASPSAESSIAILYEVMGRYYVSR